MTLLFAALQFVAGLFVSTNSLNENAVGKYEFNARCNAAYDAMLLMQFAKADSLLNVEQKQNPNNLIPYFIANYKDYILIAFNENRKDFDAWYPNKDKRLSKLASGDDTSPYYLFTQAEVSLQWALINLKFENYSAAFWDIRRAYNYLTDNKKKFPNFIANDKSLGVLHALIGAVPDSYKWAVGILGFHGTVDEGLREIKSVVDYGERNADFPFTDEARYEYVMLRMVLLADKEGAYQMTESAAFPTKANNPLACFFRGYTSMRNYKTDRAIEYFKYNFEQNKSPLHYNNYLLGMSLLNKLDYDAETYLAHFCTNFKGSNYLKDAFLRRAWIKLLQNNQQGYLDMLKNIPTRGITLTDSDKGAQKAADTKTIPHVTLLKSRLLMDGGYYQQALNLLAGKTAIDFSKPEEQVEFTYRAGRIYDLMGNKEKAIAFYKEAIQRGSKLPVYFAASAALELGNIYFAQNNKTEAKRYYQMCLDMPSSDFKNSIDIKAKAGLQRVGGK